MSERKRGVESGNQQIWELGCRRRAVGGHHGKKKETEGGKKKGTRPRNLLGLQSREPEVSDEAKKRRRIRVSVRETWRNRARPRLEKKKN